MLEQTFRVRLHTVTTVLCSTIIQTLSVHYYNIRIIHIYRKDVCTEWTCKNVCINASTPTSINTVQHVVQIL